MTNFKVTSITVDYYEENVEAESEDEAQEIFEGKLENGELQPQEGYIFYEEDEEFEPIDSIVRVDEELEDEDEEEDIDEI